MPESKIGPTGYLARWALIALMCMAGTLALQSMGGAQAQAQNEPLSLGTITVNDVTDPSCPAGYSCQGIQVTCPGLSVARQGFIATIDPAVPTEAVAVFSSGGGGVTYWGDAAAAQAAIGELRQQGFMIVQHRWMRAWYQADPGEQPGPALSACRSATLYRWVYDNLYVPLGLDPPVGECGFCITGSSGGASQASFPLTHYGLDVILDAVVPTGGPAHGSISKGCLQTAGEEDYWFAPSEANTIDRSYGYGSDGPCSQHDPTATPQWDCDSLAVAGRDHYHPSTRVHFIFGKEDGGVARSHATDYHAALGQGASPHLAWELVASGHVVQLTTEGAQAIKKALLASTSGGATSPSPAPTPITTQCDSPTGSITTGPTAELDPRSVTLTSASRKAPVRTAVMLSGRVEADDPSCREGVSVQIRRRVLGTTEFLNAALVETGEDGTFQKAVEIQANADYIAFLRGREPCAESISAAVTVLAKPLLEAQADPVVVSKGARFFVYGRLYPAHPDTRVVLLTRKDGVWTDVGRTTLDRNSAYKFERKAVWEGRRAFRVEWRNHDKDHERAKSSRLIVRIRVARTSDTGGTRSR